MSDPHFMSRGTPYMLDTHGGGPSLPCAAGGELERCALRGYIRRCCDADDRRSSATLPDRYTATVEDALRWQSAIEPASHKE